MITLCLDPGVTTGWALVVDGLLTEAGQTEHGTLVEVWEFLCKVNPNEVVSESFRLYSHKSGSKTNSGFPEIETIGVVRLWCQLFKCPHKEYPASMAKEYASDDVVKYLQMWQPNAKHANDAVRHAILHFRMRKNGGQPPNEINFSPRKKSRINS